MKLYVIAGLARSGKNTLGNQLKTEWEKQGKRVCLLRITAPLYHYAEDYFGWDGKEEHRNRSFFQKFGIDYIKEELNMPHFLLNRLKEDIHILDKFFDIGIITDARLIEEINTLKKEYKDIKILLIKRKEDNGLTEEEKQHITEQDLKKINQYDQLFLNTTKEDLIIQAQNFIKKEGLR